MEDLKIAQDTLMDAMIAGALLWVMHVQRKDALCLEHQNACNVKMDMKLVLKTAFAIRSKKFSAVRRRAMQHRNVAMNRAEFASKKLRLCLIKFDNIDE